MNTSSFLLSTEHYNKCFQSKDGDTLKDDNLEDLIKYMTKIRTIEIQELKLNYINKSNKFYGNFLCEILVPYGEDSFYININCFGIQRFKAKKKYYFEINDKIL